MGLRGIVDSSGCSIAAGILQERVLQEKRCSFVRPGQFIGQTGTSGRLWPWKWASERS